MVSSGREPQLAEKAVPGRGVAVLLTAALGLLALVSAGVLALAVRGKVAAASADAAQAQGVFTSLDRVSAALEESQAAASRFRETAEANDARAAKEATDRVGLEIRALGRLVPEGSAAGAARTRLDLLVAQQLAAGAGGGELGRLLGERVHASIDDVGHRTRQVLDVQAAELRDGLARDLGLLLLALGTTLGSGIALARAALASSSGRDRVLYLSVGDPPPTAPPLLQDAVEALNDGVLVVDAHGRRIACNPAAMTILDLEGSEPAGKRRGPQGLYFPTEGPPSSTARNPLVRALGGERVDGVEMSVGPPTDPGSRRVILSARPFRGPDGTRRGAAVVLHDVTDLKRAQTALKRSEERILRVFDGVPVALLALDADGRIRRANRAAATLLDVSSAKLAGTPWSDWVETGAVVQVGTAEVPDLGEGAVRVVALSREQAPDPAPAPQAVPALPPASPDGEARADLLRLVLEGLPVGVVLLDEDGGVDFANEVGRRLWPPEARWADSDEPVRPGEWVADRMRAVGSPLLDRAIELLDPEGRARTVGVTVLPLRPDGGGPAAVVLLEDRTEERRLRADRQRLRGRSAALVERLRDARLALAALGSRPPVCPSCKEARAARSFWARVGRAVEEASCPECQGIAPKSGARRGAGAEAAPDPGGALLGSGRER